MLGRAHMDKDLFDAAGQHGEPLASRMRPRTVEEFVGQEHILGPGRLLRRAIQADQLASLIFYGPPGTGKTTLARVIANTTRSHFVSINAVLAGVKEIREATAEADSRRKHHGRRTTLFVDEVHRWNKAQQDALLPWVENGTVVLIGATTENPFFEVNPALVSRSRIFQLKPLSSDDLRTIAERTLKDQERGYGAYQVSIEPEALEHLVDVSGGDARTLLNALELAVETTPERFPPSPESRSASACPSPRRASSAAWCSTTRKATTTSTPSAPSSRACAARTPTPRCTGWRAWCTPGRTRASCSAAC